MAIFKDEFYQKIWDAIKEKYDVDLEIFSIPQSYSKRKFMFRINTTNINAPFYESTIPFGYEDEFCVEYFVKCFELFLKRGY